MAGRSNRRERNHLPGSLPKFHAAYPRRVGRHRHHQNRRAGCLRPMTRATDGTVLRPDRSGPLRPPRASIRKLFRGQSPSERRAGGSKPQGFRIGFESYATMKPSTAVRIVRLRYSCIMLQRSVRRSRSFPDRELPARSDETSPSRLRVARRFRANNFCRPCATTNARQSSTPFSARLLRA